MFSLRSAQARKRLAAIVAIAAGTVASTVLLEKNRFFRLVHLKARDLHFVVRGTLPIRDIVLITMDKKALFAFPELLVFWHPYYATAVRAAADGGAKVLGLDVTFAVPVDKYEPENDSKLLEAVDAVSSRMPVVFSYIPAMMERQRERGWVVPINIYAATMRLGAFANLTVDPSDDFVRVQELIEAPDPASLEPPARGLSLRVAEKLSGEEARFEGGRLVWRGRPIPITPDRTITINYAGGPGTFPRVSLADVVEAYRAGRKEQLAQWFRGKVALLGPDYDDDRHATPFYTPFSERWNTAGVEIHASTLRTLLEGDYLLPVREGVRYAALSAVSLVTAVIVASLAASQAALWLSLAVLATAVVTQVLFRFGLMLSTSELLLACLVSVLGSMVYRFLTAEKRGALFQSAVSLFVGKQLAAELSEKGKISLSGKRQTVTILFSDIRGFTAFCEEKDPAVVVDLLNQYMASMVAVIVSFHGSANKFIGDGILAIFCDDDEGLTPGDHALRAARCGIAMAQVPGQFKTGVGIHTGPAVVGNVGSQDKMEYTVLGDTVNLASRLESLNKEMKTQLLLSEATKELMDGRVETVHLGAVPVRGKTLPLNVYTAAEIYNKKKEPKPEAVAEKS